MKFNCTELLDRIDQLKLTLVCSLTYNEDFILTMISVEPGEISTFLMPFYYVRDLLNVMYILMDCHHLKPWLLGVSHLPEFKPLNICAHFNLI